ncbi:hypothetical protein [Fulvivirga sp.]|uniref:hypothetical protein n=1 Tax=Fulvivirga sp. TaxID=1931237 RepID=UPI0032F005C3
MKSFTDLSIISNNAYKLAELIENGHYNNIFYYEFHEEVNPEGIWNCLEGLEEFQKRADDSYKIFFSYGYVDELPAVIHIAVNIADEWFIAKDCGSNYYLGFGPTGILRMRNACLNKGIMGFVSDENFDDWLQNKFGKTPKPLVTDGKNQDANQFKRICAKLEHLTVDMQNQPQEYQGLNEENIRAKIKTPLNVIFQGRVFAEAKNYKGKTDILIKTKDGLNEHIFELKVWDGIKTLKDAIDQVGGYLGWHNNFCGIIVFSYHKNLTTILDKTEEYLQENFSSVNRNKENEFRFRMPHQNDDKKNVETHLVFINLKYNKTKHDTKSAKN